MEIQYLIEYLQEKTDPETTKKVEEWILQSEENRKQVEDIYYLLFISDKAEAYAKIDVKEAYQEFCEKYSKTSSADITNTSSVNIPKTSSIDITNTSSDDIKNTSSVDTLKISSDDITKTSKVRKIRTWSKAPYVAAIALLFIISGMFLGIIMQNNKNQLFTVSTKLGERALVELPDGTQAWLNACSDISYSQTIFPRKRNVILNGEAYFDVAHNKRSPFVVNTDKVNIEVLGTKFNVRNNRDERYVTTTLIEGSIKFNSEHAGINLKLSPGEEMKFDKNDRNYSLLTHSNTKEAIGWIDGRLIFRNNTLQEIAGLLQQNYNVRIHFADEEVKNERFNADFEINDNIYQILSILELTNRFSYEINNRDITISSK